MTDPLQSIKLGQSLFQDTFFVANSQLTPYRKLRQLELELNELNTTIKKADIQKRRHDILKQQLDPKNPLHALDLEELQLDEEQNDRLIADAVHRRDNFLKLQEQLIQSVPQEYWDQGFENAEFEHWTKHFAKQLQISILAGTPNAQLIEQISNLPEDMVKNIMLEGKMKAKQFARIDQSTTGEQNGDQ